MTHLILVALRNREDDIALPLWEPLLSTDSEQRAMQYWIKSQRTTQHRYSLWVSVDDRGFIGLRGYVVWSSNADTWQQLTLPVEITEAKACIDRMMQQHNGCGKGVRFAPVQ